MPHTGAFIKLTITFIKFLHILRIPQLTSIMVGYIQ